MVDQNTKILIYVFLCVCACIEDFFSRVSPLCLGLAYFLVYCNSDPVCATACSGHCRSTHGFFHVEESNRGPGHLRIQRLGMTALKGPF